MTAASAPRGVVYLDHNATTPPAAEVVREMTDVQAHAWANPSSTHAPGQAARRVLVDARARIAASLGAQAQELVFTSGATEANHLAVLGALRARRAEGRSRLVLSAVEHPGLLALAARLRDEDGVPVDILPVDAQGRPDRAALRELLRTDVALVSVMGANNETGVCMPLADLAQAAHGVGAWLHVDATQLVGKAPVDFDRCPAQLMSVSAHKLYGPKGVGALLVRKGLTLPALLSGRQERQRRGGTENLPAIAGFAAACERAIATLASDVERMGRLRDRLEQALQAGLGGVHVYGQGSARLPNTSCLRFGDLPAEQVLARLERAGVVASSGAACSAGGTQPSHVLLAMGATAAHAKGGVRFSLGRDTTGADIEQAITAALRVLAPLLPPAPARPPTPFFLEHST